MGFSNTRKKKRKLKVKTSVRSVAACFFIQMVWGNQTFIDNKSNMPGIVCAVLAIFSTFRRHRSAYAAEDCASRKLKLSTWRLSRSVHVKSCQRKKTQDVTGGVSPFRRKIRRNSPSLDHPFIARQRIHITEQAQSDTALAVLLYPTRSPQLHYRTWANRRLTPATSISRTHLSCYLLSPLINLAQKENHPQIETLPR
jgi:hypothetical protein